MIRSLAFGSNNKNYYYFHFVLLLAFIINLLTHYAKGTPLLFLLWLLLKSQILVLFTRFLVLFNFPSRYLFSLLLIIFYLALEVNSSFFILYFLFILFNSYFIIKDFHLLWLLIILQLFL